MLKNTQKNISFTKGIIIIAVCAISFSSIMLKFISIVSNDETICKFNLSCTDNDN